MMTFLGSWQFWVAVIVVTMVAHFLIGMILPKLSGGGS